MVASILAVTCDWKISTH